MCNISIKNITNKKNMGIAEQFIQGATKISPALLTVTAAVQENFAK